MEPTTDLLLKYSHNVVEHLGLKLYQNKPTRVIAEVVSNAWDADARNVLINMDMGDSDRWVAVIDNGTGMTRNDLSSSFLVIGHARRRVPSQPSGAGRLLMGRKGIGKLAPFGIARFVEVLTAAKVEGKSIAYWLRFDLKELLTQGEGAVAYEPELVAEGVDLDDLSLARDLTGQALAWREHIRTTGTGTLILMTELSLVRAISEPQLLESLGTRLLVTIGHGFSVIVNGSELVVANGLPACEFRIPPSGFLTETVDNRVVRYWTGFVESAAWPQDQAGVGVYAHGKIAQDRPFTFGVKGKEIFTRYMFSAVEADWLDELKADLVSTDRTNINWQAPEVQLLYTWGQAKVRIWTAEFQKWRKDQEQLENRKRVQSAVRKGDVQRFTEPEEEEIVRLVSSITPAFGKDEDAEIAKDRLVNAVSDAWVQKPMRKLVQDLWASIGHDGGMPPEAFTIVVERLTSHSVPESLNLAVVFGQRAFALTRLHDYVHHGSEMDLQKLIERFPWIVQPDLAVLTANESLKTAVKKAEGLGQIPTGRRTTVGGVPDANKPDFVFLSSPEERQIVIVELKNPQLDLTIDNIAQLQDYMMWVQTHYPEADLTGYLIGRQPTKMTSRYEGLYILPWTDVLNRSRARNLELLAAMLLRSGATSGGDARVSDAIHLGGPEAQALLSRLAADHTELRDLMESFKLVDNPILQN